MGSYQFLDDYSNQVSNSSSFRCLSNITLRRRGLSKTQMCLHKILGIIASYPPQEISFNPQVFDFDEGNNNKGLDIDLNVDLRPSPGIDCLSDCSTVDVAEKSSLEGECDPVLKSNGEEEKEVKTAPFQEEEENRDCFSLLIEAAEMVSGYKAKSPVEEKESEGGCGGDVSVLPVVRSKRGRSQVLPSRYRDSVVLAPWKRLPPPLMLRPRKPAAAPMVSRKRGKLNSTTINKS